MKDPLVSVIIPAYNAGDYIGVTIDSVLNQTFPDWELIVVIDGAADSTEEIVKAFADQDARIGSIVKQNTGVSKTRNVGIKNAVGKYIAFLDADDIWEAEKLEKQVDALESDLTASACYSAFSLVDRGLKKVGERRSDRHSKTLEDLLTRGNVVATPSTVVVERRLFDTVGGFDPEFSLCADWEMWIRLSTETEFIYIDELLVKYRMHDSNMSNDAQLLEADTIRLLEKSYSALHLRDEIIAFRSKAYAANYMIFSGSYFHSGEYKDFLRCAYRALTYDLGQVKHLVSFPIRIARRWTGKID